MAPPSRTKLKKAMLAMFLETDNAKKKKCSKKFTKLLFEYVEAYAKTKDEDEIALLQMQSIGIFSQYVFRKNQEKSGQKEKNPKKTLEKIAEESDELYDEIEANINQQA